MARNGKVFISHTAHDDAQTAALLMALKTKHCDVWYERAPTEGMNALEPAVQRAVEERDVFIRILTHYTVSSQRMALELAAFQQAQALDAQHGEGQRRVQINLIVDPDYQRQPTDVGTLTINTTNKPQGAWLPSLFSELGQLKASATLSTGAMTAIVGVAVLLALGGLIGSLVYFASMHPELIH